MSGAGAGCYLVLEGPDGCGKSSQAEALTRRFQTLGREVVHLREPGSTPVGEHLRTLLLNPASGDLSPWTEVLLFTAARLEMFRQEVKPALVRGSVVLVERCYLSTMVYQGLALDEAARVPLERIEELTQAAYAQGGLALPDRVIVLDLDWEHASQRMASRVMDRIEARGASHWQAVRDAYVVLAGDRSECSLVDARGALDDVSEQLWGAIQGAVRG